MNEALALSKGNVKKEVSVVKKEVSEEEVNAAMPSDAPTGNSKEDRKKRRLIRNRVSAQLHRERKKKYISSLEDKVKEQSEQLFRMRSVIESLTQQNMKLRELSLKNQCPSCASSGSDSSLPYSPVLSGGSDTDDIEEEVMKEEEELSVIPKDLSTKRLASMEVEDMGDLGEYADTLFDGVDLTDEAGDGMEFELGLWPDSGESGIDSLGDGTPTNGQQNKRKFAFLFGIFFMTALFGSSMMVGQSNHPVLVIEHPVAKSMETAPSVVHQSQPTLTSSRRRRLLSIPTSTSNTMMDKKNRNGTRLFSLWQNILHDATPLKNGTQCSAQDVKQLVYKIENMSSGFGMKTSRVANTAPRLRASVQTSKPDTSLVAYNRYNNVRSINFPEQATSNASFLLCPKPYGSMAQQRANEHHDDMDSLMYDDVKVNRDLVLFMPSTSVGIKQAPGSAWDGQWVQVNAIVKNIRAANGFEKMSAIASL